MSSLNDRLKTEVDRYRLRFSASRSAVVFAWDYPGSELLRVRIVRAQGEAGASGEAASARSAGDEAGEAPTSLPAAPPGPSSEPPADSPWRLVYEGVTGSFRDTGVTEGATYRYAVFARLGHEPWMLWRDVRLLVP